MAFYSIRHLTRFKYEQPVSESVMETRMHPRSDGHQRCLSYLLSVSPRCRLQSYRDHLGNDVHHFNIPSFHSELVIVSEALVEQQPLPEVPQALTPQAWAELDALVAGEDYWEMLLPSDFARPTPALLALARDLNVERRSDPLTVVRDLNAALFHGFQYVPLSTSVDSPIDEAIESRQGVCQDFAHIMIALLRQVRIPSRYVSGYLDHGREARPGHDATHAWVEVLLPGLGWIGFDATNNLLARDRHIRTAIGRDYADVPPTHGIFRGTNSSELYVAVHVDASETPPTIGQEVAIPENWTRMAEHARELPPQAMPPLHFQQMQQQQNSRQPFAPRPARLPRS
ncbi:MAG: transglutaminase family protein [Acidobacteriaceae bacterium]